MSNRLERILKRRFITSDDIRNAAARGEQSLAVPENSTVTDEARELALKLSLRLDEAGRPRPVVPAPGAPVARAAATVPPRAPAASPSNLPDDTGGRVTNAIASVLEELDLGDRAASLLPVIARRVFAGLAANRR